MEIIKTKYLSRSVVKEEIEHTIEVSGEEAEKLQAALEIIKSLKEKTLPESVLLSEWYSFDYKVDKTTNLVYTTVKHGMVG